MDYNYLGRTDLKVSKLCYGTLTIGPLQRNLSIEDSVQLFEEAINNGINFFDTAELYKTYTHLRAGIECFGRNKFIISTKSYAYDEETAKRSLDKALNEMKTDYIDVFSLHEQESEHSLRGHNKAIEYFYKMKEEGIIKALGLSTHHIAGVIAGTKSSYVDIIHPIINVKGLGIQDGTIDEMLEAVKNAYEAGKGIYAMKILGGGNLINMSEECFEFVLNLKYLHSVAIGMQSIEEIKANALRINNIKLPEDLRCSINSTKRKLHIDTWCELCCQCVEHCSHGALSILDDKIIADERKCVLCGYCSAWCPQFCIKII